MQGTIVKAISGFYYVLCGGEVVECKARGVFRKQNVTPLVGDHVVVEDSTVTEILPRKNEFDRPPAANVEVMLLVVTASNPAPSFEIIDELSVDSLKKGCETVICINKCDEADPQLLEKLLITYKSVFPAISCSSLSGEGINELKELISGKTAALCGPSGSGKSTLANTLLGAEHSVTGSVSEKTGRGKNTTRHTELFSGEGFLLFDTPGFTSFEAKNIPSEEIEGLFPDLLPFIGKCRFEDCVHLKEPGCAVTDAVRAGKISRSRYRSYRKLYKAAKESEDYYG